MKNLHPPTPRRRVLIIEDHPATQAGLVALIDGTADLQVCGRTESWKEALQLTRETRPDVLLLDLNLKDGNGWSLIEQLSAANLLPPTLVLSVFSEEVYAPRLLQAGARGYISKTEPMEKVLDGIRRVLDGHYAFSEAITTRLIGRKPGAPVTQELDDLSDRELQVFEMLGEGRANKEIAQRMNLSIKTVGTYKARLMEKLGITNSPDLMRRAQKDLMHASTSLPAEKRDAPLHQSRPKTVKQTVRGSPRN